MDNIFGGEDSLDLFSEEEITQDPQENEDNDKDTTEENLDELFEDQDDPESVGSEDKDKQEDTTSDEAGGSSPDKFYSSIAQAFKEDGIFADLDDEVIKKIQSPEDLAEAIEQQIQARFDEKQKRIDEALNYGLEPSQIQYFERTLNFLEEISNEDIEDEEKGEDLRKRLIYQDFINRGFSEDRAKRELKKSLDAGSDVEDAKDALRSNLDFYKKEYEGLINEGKEEEKREKQKQKAMADNLKKSIMDSKTVFGNMNIDKATRQTIYNNITKPVYKDPDTGELYTAIQKYELDNREDFLKNIGILFTLTDGFKNIDKLVKPNVTKELKKGIRNLERTINGSSRNSDGSLRFTSGVGDKESSFSLDI